MNIRSDSFFIAVVGLRERSERDQQHALPVILVGKKPGSEHFNYAYP